ncbi:RCC1 domain-containing protein [Bifidobacterium xylocopae]|uniref:Chromosome condensation regulator RCC1 n=1 Tax=Bifidobacterium xylocopae TaxID=2493119 RepID=A0A366KDG4_9BIFI|nr:hypothetical protein CRD59_04875 [Bifidobacterium xylocopae]
MRINDPAGKPNTTWTAISSGWYHSLAIDSGHHAHSWGQNTYGQLGNGTTSNRKTSTPVNDPAGKSGTTWTAISTGGATSLAIDSDSHAYSWGATIKDNSATTPPPTAPGPSPRAPRRSWSPASNSIRPKPARPLPATPPARCGS